MKSMLDVCSGIGGMSLAAHLTGAIATRAFAEVEPFPCAVLAHHFPQIPNLGDVHGITKARLAHAGLLPIHIVAGGFPCQGNSFAGKRKGRQDTRNLWPAMAHLVSDIGPEWFVGENVLGLLSVGVERGRDHGLFGDIQRDLAQLGYASGWCVLSAADIGAPHLRKRVFILANRDGERIKRAMRYLADARSTGGGLQTSNHRGQAWSDTRTRAAAMVRCSDRTADAKRIITGRRKSLADASGAGLSQRDGGESSSRSCTESAGSATGAPQFGMGDATDGLPRWVVGRFPAAPGQPQHAWEAPRTVTESVLHRAAKLKALGNAVVPAQVYPVFAAIVAVEHDASAVQP